MQVEVLAHQLMQLHEVVRLPADQERSHPKFNEGAEHGGERAGLVDAQQLEHRPLAAKLDALKEAGVPYMLTGSFASAFHGAPRATHDIDVVIAPNVGSLN